MIVLIIPYSRRLDQLLKTAAASLSNMSHLLLVWLVLYFAYGIALNQIFGLTKIGPNGSLSINFRTVPNALILLFRMSCGEGWNQVLDDFIVERPFVTDKRMEMTVEVKAMPIFCLLAGISLVCSFSQIFWFRWFLNNFLTLPVLKSLRLIEIKFEPSRMHGAGLIKSPEGISTNQIWWILCFH